MPTGCKNLDNSCNRSLLAPNTSGTPSRIAARSLAWVIYDEVVDTYVVLVLKIRIIKSHFSDKLVRLSISP